MENKNPSRLGNKSFKTFSVLEKSLPGFVNGDEDGDDCNKCERESQLVVTNESDYNASSACLREKASDQETLPINEYMKLVKIEADKQKAQRKELLHRRLATLRSEISNRQQAAILPLYIFPEEILEHVADYKYMENLIAANPYFERVMKNSRVARLFEKVFPLIRNELYYDDIQSCSLVCRQWHKTMDKTLAQYFTTDDRQCSSYSNNVNQVLEEPKVKLSSIVYCAFCEYSMNLDQKESFNDILSCCYEYYDYHTEYLEFDYWRWVLCDMEYDNPLTAKFTTFNVKNSSYEYYFDEFLIDFGSRVCYLDLSLDVFVPKALDFCQNLKRLRIRDSRPDSDDKGLTCNSLLVPLPTHPCLEHLESELIGKTSAFQDKLVQQYSSQLKHVNVQRWNFKLYHHLNWDNLRILDAVHLKHFQVFRSLKNLTAPNLKYISVWIRDVNECRIETLMRFVNRFPKLETFHLKFPDKFQAFPRDERVGVGNQGFTCSNSLAELVIEINKRNLSAADRLRNFLLCFPFLRKLEIVMYRTPDDESYLEADNICDIALNSKKLRGGKFQISKYFLHQDAKGIYKSYIWNVIPSLQSVTVKDWKSSKLFARRTCNNL